MYLNAGEWNSFGVFLIWTGMSAACEHDFAKPISGSMLKPADRRAF